jgi:GTP-binding protein
LNVSAPSWRSCQTSWLAEPTTGAGRIQDLKLLTAELITSASTGGPRDGLLQDDLAQFAFVGRSNVGKSSLLNALTRQKLARTSAAAGKTRLANIFRITVEGGQGGPGTWGAYLVDLPGFGYARGGDAAARELAAVVEAYLSAAARLQQRPSRSEHGQADPFGGGAILLLVDSRHPGLPMDVEAHRWLSETVAPPRIVATKVDKLSQSERSRNLREIARLFGAAPLPVSVTTGEGLDELWRMIASLARNTDRSRGASPARPSNP